MQDTFNVIKSKQQYDRANKGFYVSSAAVLLTGYLCATAFWDSINVDRNMGYINLDHVAAGECVGYQFGLHAGHSGNLQRALESDNVVFDMDRSGYWLQDCIEYKQAEFEEAKQEAHSWWLLTSALMAISCFWATYNGARLNTKQRELDQGLEELAAAAKHYGVKAAGTAHQF